MNLLGLECSTPWASAVLMNEADVVCNETWHEERARHEGLFEYLEHMMKTAGWTWQDLDMITVGRGPGAYSGLRVSLLAAQALAAPGRIPVMSVSSMEALAGNLMQEHALREIILLGDARRESIWTGHCQAEKLNRQTVDWRVIPATDLPAGLGKGPVLATPHWDELAAVRASLNQLHWLRGPQRPTAEQVARLALERQRLGAPPEPLTPLYLHPAV